MRKNSTAAMGALHPFLFLLFVYAISLTMSVFVCRMIFFSINKEDFSVKNHSVSKSFDATAWK